MSYLWTTGMSCLLSPLPRLRLIDAQNLHTWTQSIRDKHCQSSWRAIMQLVHWTQQHRYWYWSLQCHSRYPMPPVPVQPMNHKGFPQLLLTWPFSAKLQLAPCRGSTQRNQGKPPINTNFPHMFKACCWAHPEVILLYLPRLLPTHKTHMHCFSLK